MQKILVTGGCGYIGAHTVVDLIENGYEVISIDDNSRSTTYLLDGIEKLTGKKLKNYKVDLKNFDETLAVFQDEDSFRSADGLSNTDARPLNDQCCQHVDIIQPCYNAHSRVLRLHFLQNCM